MSISRTLFITVLAAFLTGQSNTAIISGTAIPSDTFLKIEPPQTVGNNNHQLNNAVLAFDEKKNYTLETAIHLDLVPEGSLFELKEGSIVSSHYVFVDPSTPKNRAAGTVTFNQPILGVIKNDLNLPTTNFLGAIQTTYLSHSALALKMKTSSHS